MKTNKISFLRNLSTITLFAVLLFGLAPALAAVEREKNIDKGAIVIDKGVDINAFQSILKEITSYDFDKSRLKLTELSNMITKAYGNPKELKQMEKSLCEFLSTDATFAAKQFVCHQLSIIGTEDSVPALAKLLDNEKTSDMARYALERIPGAAVDEALRKSLASTSGKVQIGIINSIGVRRDTKAVPELEKLAGGSDNDIAAAAIAALGKIADSKSLDALAKIKSQVKCDLIQVALDSYLLCADELAKTDKPKAAKIYEELYKKDNPDNIRVAALKGLLSVSDEPAKVIADVLKDDNAEMQTAAIAIARDIPDKKVTGVLAAALEKLAPAQQIQALSALGHRDDSSAKDSVIKLIQSKDETVQIAAIKTLGMLGDASCVDMLAEIAASSSGDKKDAARESLCSIRGKDIDAAIIEKVSKADPKIKSELILALGSRGAKSAVKTVLETAKDSDAAVRESSIKALSDLAGPQDAQALVGLVADAANNSEREKAADMLAQVLASNKDASAILSSLPSAKSPEVKASLLAALGKIGDEKSLDVLRTAIKDENADIRKAAIRALSDWSTPVPAADLLAAAKDDASQVNKVLALRGYIALVSLPSDRSAKETTKMIADALAIAKSANEKRLALSALSSCECQEALDLAKSYLNDQEVAAEAKSAVSQIQKKLEDKK